MCISDKCDLVFEMISTDENVEVLSNHEDEYLINIENMCDVESETAPQGI